MVLGTLWCTSWPNRYVLNCCQVTLTFLTRGQGIDVFIVALDDDLLRTTQRELSQEFPNLRLESVPVNLGGNSDDYMTAGATTTGDIPVAIVINNAGFLKMYFF